MLAGNDIPNVWYPNLAYEPLIERAPNGQPTPGLAASWGYSKNRLSFHLNLRKGARFSDGSPVTAADVVNWLKHYQAKGGYTLWLSTTKKIVATGPMQVTLYLSSFNSLLPYGLDQDGMAGDVVGPKGLANPSSLGSSTDGAGPYMLDAKQTIANSQYVYVKNPYYYDKSAQHWGQITIKVITNASSVLAAIQSGQVQAAEGTASTAAAAKSAGLDVTSIPYSLVGAYIFDPYGKLIPALAKLKVREALSYAIDRAGITKTLYSGATPTDQVIPSGISGYVPSLEKNFPYDPAKAKQLLAQAGYPHGFSFTITDQPSVDNGDLLTQAMVQDWKAIGVNVTIKTSPSLAAYAQVLGSRKFAVTTFNFPYSVQAVATLELVNNPGLYNLLGFRDPTAISLAKDELKYDVGSPQGTKAAQTAESYMTNNVNFIGVTATHSFLFSKGLANTAYTPYPWSDPGEWAPAK